MNETICKYYRGFVTLSKIWSIQTIVARGLYSLILREVCYYIIQAICKKINLSAENALPKKRWMLLYTRYTLLTFIMIT